MGRMPDRGLNEVRDRHTALGGGFQQQPHKALWVELDGEEPQGTAARTPGQNPGPGGAAESRVPWPSSHGRWAESRLCGGEASGQSGDPA